MWAKEAPRSSEHVERIGTGGVCAHCCAQAGGDLGTALAQVMSGHQCSVKSLAAFVLTSVQMGPRDVDELLRSSVVAETGSYLSRPCVELEQIFHC